ncbi:MAG: hypothetical protein A2W91_11285 [Bacteroidetes bacterium GWF2_38_335]|nr:MAG: hypothetical protein A2W91_11285 [Bacteroidetes bacterium GWF2_38_335]OFY81720.1 MAG: hypothetical protein A2281_05755 [Bacteroidetes bacterium RIFOXYA12_FULL_38_20]HBS87784.1 hypothetical protein [Bacteroidales bacterium]
MYKRLIILIVLCSFIHVPVLGEQQSLFPFFRNTNLHKITQKVISGKETDSAKVYAIHKWITSNIKYDLKRFQQFNYSKVPLKTILKKRKAICRGYSDLFNEMCSIAGIPSTSVPGYVKDIYYDQGDGFFEDEHIWNAVYFNDNWHLLDATWDSGYVQFVKMTIIGKILYFFSWHRYTIFRYRPHFVSSPSEFYYCKSGYYYKSDHIPADPIWQMVSPQYSLKDAVLDSSFYFLLCDTITPSPINKHLNNQRRFLASMDEVTRNIADGYVFHDYNHKNHFAPGQSHLLKALKFFPDIDQKSFDSLKVINQCDTLLVMLLKSRSNLDSNFFYLSEQKALLSEKNKMKHEIMAGHYKLLSKSTTKCETLFRSGKSICRQGQSSSKKLNRDNRSKILELDRIPSYANSNNAKKTNPVDSAKAMDEIRLYRDSADIQVKIIKERINICDSIFKKTVSNFYFYAAYSKKHRNDGKAIHFLRLSGFDDLDLKIRMLKDTLIKYKFPADSAILDSTGKILVKELYKEFQKLNKDFSILLKYNKNIVNKCTALKRSCYFEDFSSQAYSETLDSFSVKVQRLSPEISSFSGKFSLLADMCGNLAKLAKKEKKVYIEEKTIEDALYISRASYIIRHFKSRALHNTQYKKLCRDLENITQKIRGKYDKRKV